MCYRTLPKIRGIERPDPVVIQDDEVENTEPFPTITVMSILVAVVSMLVVSHVFYHFKDEKPVTIVDILQDDVHNISPENNDLNVLCFFDRIEIKMNCYAPYEAYKFWSRNVALNLPLTFRTKEGTFLVWLLPYPTTLGIDGVKDYNRNAVFQEYRFSTSAYSTDRQSPIIHGRFCRIDKAPNSDKYYLRLGVLSNIFFFVLWMLSDYYSRYRGIELHFISPEGRYRILMFLMLVMFLCVPLAGITYINLTNKSMGEEPCRNLDDQQQTARGNLSGINKATAVFRMEQIKMFKENIETYKAYRFEPGNDAGSFTLTLYTR